MSVNKDEFIIEPLKNAAARFADFYSRSSIDDDLTRSGVIKAFEYTYELSWKTLRKVLIVCGHNEARSMTAKSIFREAAVRGLIDDAELWFKFIDKRNLTVHTYKEEVAIEVYDYMDEFRDEIVKLIPRIESALK